jgi:uncharacterized membrane protein YdbT with pleckstrin-like domain
MVKDFSKTLFLLFPNEKIIFKTNPHWLLLIAPIIALGIFLFLYLSFLCPVFAETDFASICFILSMVAFPFVILIYYLEWRFNRLYLTNLRLVRERGIIGKRFMSIFLEQVEDITVSYGIVGRIFRFGDLIIESAGTFGNMLFPAAPWPLQKKYQIEVAILEMKN